jgi:hypothetical protein
MHFARVEVTRILSLVLLPCSPSPPTFARSVIPGNWCMLSVESRRTGIARRRLSSTGFPQPLRSARGRSAARRRRVPARLSQRWVAQPPLDLLVGLGGAKVAVQKHVQAQRVVPTFMILGPRPSAGGDDGAAPSEPAAAAWAWPCTFGRDDSMTSTLGAAGCTVQSCTSPLWQDSQSRCPRLVPGRPRCRWRPGSQRCRAVPCGRYRSSSPRRRCGQRRHSFVFDQRSPAAVMYVHVHGGDRAASAARGRPPSVPSADTWLHEPTSSLLRLALHYPPAAGRPSLSLQSYEHSRFYCAWASRRKKIKLLV